jgi:hypothetical protein
MRKDSRSRFVIASGLLAGAAILGTAAAVAAPQGHYGGSPVAYKYGGSQPAGQWGGAQPGSKFGGAQPDSKYAG